MSVTSSFRAFRTMRQTCAHQHSAQPLQVHNTSRLLQLHTPLYLGTLKSRSPVTVCRNAADAVSSDIGIAEATNRLASTGAGELVALVLNTAAGTDGGVDMATEQRAVVDGLLDQLEQIGSTQQPRPLDNPLLFGNYNVAYTSTTRAPTERGQPAGGRFRGRIGRALFQTTGVYQSVLEPDIVTNKVSFKLLGMLPGSIGLRGKVIPVAEGESHGSGKAGQKDTVKVLFEPPILSFADCLYLRIGPPSSVQLSTQYLDERVRLGKGSRGSLFVFTRGGAADEAGMDQVGIQKSTKSGLVWLTAAFLAMLAGGYALWTTGTAALKVMACGMWLVSILLGSVMRAGGVIRDDEDIKRVQEIMQLKQQEMEEHRQQQQQAEPADTTAASGAAAA